MLILFYSKTSRLGRRKCQSTTRAPNNIVSVKTQSNKNVYSCCLKAAASWSFMFSSYTHVQRATMVYGAHGDSITKSSQQQSLTKYILTKATVVRRIVTAAGSSGTVRYRRGEGAGARPTRWPPPASAARHLRRTVTVGIDNTASVRLKTGTHYPYVRAFCPYGPYVRVVCTGRPFMSPVMLYPFNCFLV